MPWTAWPLPGSTKKTNRSSSASTRRTYLTFLSDFRATLAEQGCDLDSDPRRVAPVVQAWAAQEVVDKRGMLQAPSATYHNQRLAVLASFYEYAIRRGVLERDPIAAVMRRPIQDDVPPSHRTSRHCAKNWLPSTALTWLADVTTRCWS